MKCFSFCIIYWQLLCTCLIQHYYYTMISSDNAIILMTKYYNCQGMMVKVQMVLLRPISPGLNLILYWAQSSSFQPNYRPLVVNGDIIWCRQQLVLKESNIYLGQCTALRGTNRNSCFHKLSRPSKCVNFNVGYLPVPVFQCSSSSVPAFQFQWDWGGDTWLCLWTSSSLLGGWRWSTGGYFPRAGDA